MASRRYYCRPPLSAFVACLWYWEGAPSTHTHERLLPNGEPSLIFNLRDEPIRIYDPGDLTRYQDFGRAVVSGARNDCFVIDTNQQERVIGIQFKPGGAFPFFPVPASELQCRSFSLDDLWPRRAGLIREQLLAAPNVDAMLAALERCLMSQLVRPLELHPAVRYAIDRFDRPHPSRIAAITEELGISQRHFIHLFHTQVGLTPKSFFRVRRFQRVLHVLQRPNEIDWPQVALDCGYYDQAHFIHDFRVFSGLSPKAYVALATPHLNHVPLPRLL